MKMSACNVIWRIVLLAVLLTLPLGGRLDAAVRVTLINVDGESHTGTLTGLTADEVTLSVNDQPQKLDARDVLEIQFDHKRIKPHLSSAVLFLANGDRLAAKPETIDDTRALAGWEAFPGWPSVEVPLETISGFVLDMPEIAALRSDTLRTVLDRKQKSDLVDLKNGDQAGGEFLGLTETALRLDSPVGETAIERESIRLVTMNRELISFPDLQGPAMLLALADGSRITATDLKLEPDDRLKLTAAFGAKMDLPLAAVLSMRRLGGRAVYLSDLRPIQYEHKPYLAGQWDLKTDQNVRGEPFYLDGQEYPKGLGMHSQSSVSYDLKGEYQTFRATIGVDDAADNQGSVVFEVEVDGETKYKSDPQTARHTAIKLPPVSLAGAKRLTLRAEFAEFGDTLDYADWCDAVLIR